MLKARKIILGIYICFTIIFLNFGIQILPDYQLTIAVIYPFSFLLLGRLRFSLYRLNIYLFAILFPILIGIVGYISFQETELIPFLRSYSLYFHFCFSLLIVNSVEIKSGIMENIDKAIVIALFIIVGFTLLQVGISFYIGRPILFNPFGKFLIGGESDVGRFELDGRVRPTGFYWEPSTNAAVILILINYLVIRNIKKIKKYYSFQFLIQLTINSTTGILASAITFIFWLNSNYKKYFLLKFCLILSLISIFTFITYDRITTIATSGSGFFRWGLPFIYFLDYVQAYPLGLPLGQLAYPLDNGLFVALIYTGIIGFTAALVLLFIFLKKIIQNRITIETQLFIISILLIMIFNGAFLTPEMSFLICLITLAWKSQKSEIILASSL